MGTLKKIAFAAGGLAAAYALATPFYVYGTGDTAEFTVTGRERIVEKDSDGSASSRYLVYSQDETFENIDSWLRLKFNSSDIQGKLVEGSKVKCDVYGWRIHLLSNYRNIVSCEQVAPAAAPAPAAK